MSQYNPGPLGVLSIVLMAAADGLKAAGATLLDCAESLDMAEDGRVYVGSLVIMTKDTMERRDQACFKLAQAHGAAQVREKFGLPKPGGISLV